MSTDARADFEAATRAIVIPFPSRHEPLTTIDEEIARGLLAVADLVVTALGEQGARKALSALSGAALAPSELALVRPLANALARLLEEPGTGT